MPHPRACRLCLAAFVLLGALTAAHAQKASEVANAHDAIVYSLAFSPDGKLLASAGFDGVVWLHNPDDGKLIREFLAVPLTTKTAAK